MGFSIQCLLVSKNDTILSPVPGGVYKWGILDIVQLVVLNVGLAMNILNPVPTGGCKCGASTEYTLFSPN